MFLSSSINALMLVFISTPLLVTCAHKVKLGDDLCQALPHALCVKEKLFEIANKVKLINRTIQEIEQRITKHEKSPDTFDRHANFEMGLINSDIPTYKDHAKFFKANNIDQSDLVHLLKEAHYAMAYYYNSITDVLELNDVFAFTVDSSFKTTQSIMRDIICSYRSVLRVYSQEWSWLDQTGRLPFSRHKYRSAPSLIHDVRSVIIVRFLRDWMTRINTVIINLEAKFV